MIIRKPVVHLTANVPLSVELRVGFQFGRPWYAYPLPDAYTASRYAMPPYAAGELSPGDLGALGKKLMPGYEWLVPSRAPVVSASGVFGPLDGVCWQSLIVSPKRLGWMKPAEVGEGRGYAWWKGLREVDCSWVSHREESERFVYYDGPTALRCPVGSRGSGGGWWCDRRSWRGEMTFLQVPPVELRDAHGVAGEGKGGAGDGGMGDDSADGACGGWEMAGGSCGRKGAQVSGGGVFLKINGCRADGFGEEGDGRLLA